MGKIERQLLYNVMTFFNHFINFAKYVLNKKCTGVSCFLCILVCVSPSVWTVNKNHFVEGDKHSFIVFAFEIANFLKCSIMLPLFLIQLHAQVDIATPREVADKLDCPHADLATLAIEFDNIVDTDITGQVGGERPEPLS